MLCSEKKQRFVAINKQRLGTAIFKTFIWRGMLSDIQLLIMFYYMPSTFYIVKLPLALGNIFNWTESIMAQSHDDAENPYWGLIMDFWHCLIVMTYRNRALF